MQHKIHDILTEYKSSTDYLMTKIAVGSGEGIELEILQL